MTRDRIKKISQTAAKRVAHEDVGTRPIASYTPRLKELAKKRSSKDDRTDSEHTLAK